LHFPNVVSIFCVFKRYKELSLDFDYFCLCLINRNWTKFLITPKLLTKFRKCPDKKNFTIIASRILHVLCSQIISKIKDDLQVAFLLLKLSAKGKTCCFTLPKKKIVNFFRILKLFRGNPHFFAKWILQE